jgi:hypothetical protein
MPNSISAEPMAGPQGESIGNPTDDDDKPLTHHAKPSGIHSQAHLRVVHSANRVDHLPSVDMPPPERPRPAPDRKPAMLDRTVQAQIGRMLREHFAGVAGEPVPERFVALLAELEAKEASR